MSETTIVRNGLDPLDGYEPSVALNAPGVQLEIYYSVRDYYLSIKTFNHGNRLSGTSHMTVRLTDTERKQLAKILGDAKIRQKSLSFDGLPILVQPNGKSRTVRIGLVELPKTSLGRQWAAEAALLLSGVRKWREANKPEAAVS